MGCAGFGTGAGGGDVCALSEPDDRDAEKVAGSAACHITGYRHGRHCHWLVDRLAGPELKLRNSRSVVFLGFQWRQGAGSQGFCFLIIDDVAQGFKTVLQLVLDACIKRITEIGIALPPRLNGVRT